MVQSLLSADIVSTGTPAPVIQAPGAQPTLPSRPPSPERRNRSRSPGWPGGSRARSPWGPRDRSPRGRVRSTPRYRQERDDHYRSSYDYYSRPQSPRRDNYNHYSPRPRSRSPPYIPTGPRKWNRRAKSPRNTGTFNGQSLPVGSHKRGRNARTPSPLDTMTRETGDDIPKVPTGPRGDNHTNKKARQFPQNANKEPVQESTSTLANVIPAIPSPGLFVSPKEPKSKPSKGQVTPSLKKEATPAPPKQNTNNQGAKPIGRYVAIDTPGGSTASGFLTHFPVQSVKYIDENGKHLSSHQPNQLPFSKKSFSPQDIHKIGNQLNKQTLNTQLTKSPRRQILRIQLPPLHHLQTRRAPAHDPRRLLPRLHPKERNPISSRMEHYSRNHQKTFLLGEMGRG